MSAKRVGLDGVDRAGLRLARRQLHYLADEAWGVLSDATRDGDTTAREHGNVEERPVAKRTTLRTKCLGLLRRLRRPWRRGRG